MCKAFSTHDSVVAALFHNIYFYFDKRSLKNLAHIACHELRNQVRCIIFMSPQFHGRLADEKTFGAAMKFEVRDAFAQELEGTLSDAQRLDCINYLADKFFPEQVGGDVAVMLAAYNEGLAEQIDVRNKLLVDVGGRYLPRCPNLRSVHICWTDGRDPIGAPVNYYEIENSEVERTALDVDDETYMMRRHSATGIKGIWRDLTDATRNTYLKAIMRTLSVADLPDLAELVMSDGIRLPRTFHLDDLPGSKFAPESVINLKQLVRLSLDLSDSAAWTTSSASSALLPILTQARHSLQEINLESMGGNITAFGIVDAALSLHFPKLTKFQLHWMRSSGRVLAKFINNHDHGVSWTISNVKIRRRQWSYVLHALRLRDHKGHVYIKGLDDDAFNVLTLQPKWSRPKRGRNQARTLEDYIEGNVAWKKEWTELFGRGPTGVWLEDNGDYSEISSDEGDDENDDVDAGEDEE